MYKSDYQKVCDFNLTFDFPQYNDISDISDNLKCIKFKNIKFNKLQNSCNIHYKKAPGEIIYNVGIAI